MTIFENGAFKIPHFFNPENGLDLTKNLITDQAHFFYT